MGGKKVSVGQGAFSHPVLLVHELLGLVHLLLLQLEDDLEQIPHGDDNLVWKREKNWLKIVLGGVARVKTKSLCRKNQSSKLDSA